MKFVNYSYQVWYDYYAAHLPYNTSTIPTHHSELHLRPTARLRWLLHHLEAIAAAAAAAAAAASSSSSGSSKQQKLQQQHAADAAAAASSRSCSSSKRRSSSKRSSSSKQQKLQRQQAQQQQQPHQQHQHQQQEQQQQWQQRWRFDIAGDTPPALAETTLARDGRRLRFSFDDANKKTNPYYMKPVLKVRSYK